jgi:hypothetical protein
MAVAVQGLAGERSATCLLQVIVLLQRVVRSLRFGRIKKTLYGSTEVSLLGLGALRPLLEK